MNVVIAQARRGVRGGISISILVVEASIRPKSFISEVVCISSAATQLSLGVCEGHFSRIFKNIKERLIKRLPIM